MRFFRRVKGCSRIGRIRNETIRQELQVFNLKEKIKFEGNKWQEHLERMQQYLSLIHIWEPSSEVKSLTGADRYERGVGDNGRYSVRLKHRISWTD